MRSFPTALAATLLSCSAVVEGTVHNLFVGAYKSNHIFAISFDNETFAINTEGTMVGHGGHPVLGFNYDKTVIYGGERDGWTSYSVQSPTELAYASSVQLKGRCDGDEYRHGQTSLYIAQKFPYMVYGSGRSPCGAVLGIRTDGSLDSIVQNISYRTTSRVQGMVMDPPGKYLFSADQKGNGIWTHKVDPKNGKLDRGTFTTIPTDNARPRRIVMHPDGKYLYVLLSKVNSVAMFEIVPKSNAAPQLKFTTTTFSLLPNGVDQKLYRGSDMALSADGNILYATARYRAPKDDDKDNGKNDEEEDEGEDTEDDGADEDDSSSPWNRFGGWGQSNDRNRPTGSSSSGSSSSSGWGSSGWGSNSGSSGWGSSSGSGGWGSSNSGNRNGRNSRRSETNQTASVIFADRLDNVTIQGPDVRIRQAANPGYLTSILLARGEKQGDQSQGKGYPLQMIMQVATPTTGGKSNVVAPAPWDNSYFALSDSEVGFLQVWRLEGVHDLPRDGPMASGQVSMLGAPKGGLRASQLPPQFANIRAYIVAEWRAPSESVGDPNLIKGSSGRDDKRVQRASGPPEKKLGRRQNSQKRPSPASPAASPIPSGRGCCAQAVWYD